MNTSSKPAIEKNEHLRNNHSEQHSLMLRKKLSKKIYAKPGINKMQNIYCSNGMKKPAVRLFQNEHPHKATLRVSPPNSLIEANSHANQTTRLAARPRPAAQRVPCVRCKPTRQTNGMRGLCMVNTRTIGTNFPRPSNKGVLHNPPPRVNRDSCYGSTLSSTIKTAAEHRFYGTQAPYVIKGPSARPRQAE